MNLAQLKFKLSADVGDMTGLWAEVSARHAHGAIGPDGVSVARGFPRAVIDAQGNLTAESGGPYLLNAASYDVTYSLTINRGGVPLGQGILFTPVAVDGVIDVNNLIAQGKAQTVTPEELRSVKAIAADAQAAAAEARAQGQELAELKADTAQQQEANNAQTAVNIGRRTAPSVAGIGQEAGLYNIVGGDEAGQVWERPAGGGAPARRRELEAASNAVVQPLLFDTLATALASTEPAHRVIVGGGEGGVFDLLPENDQTAADGGRVYLRQDGRRLVRLAPQGVRDAAWHGGFDQTVLNAAAAGRERLKGGTVRWTTAQALDVNPRKLRGLTDLNLFHEGPGAALLMRDPSSEAALDAEGEREPVALRGRTAAAHERLNLEGDGQGVAFFFGGSENYWAASLQCLRDFRVRKFNTAIAITSNSYMQLFERGIISELPEGGFGVVNDATSSNSGENLTFRNVYFFNNAGTCAQLDANGGRGWAYYFENCSFDYSHLAALAKNGARMIFSRCWIETSPHQTTGGEYFRAEQDAELVFNECDFILAGDWRGKVLIRNTGSYVKIAGGRLTMVGDGCHPPDRLIDDVSGGLSHIEGLRFGSGLSPTRLGQSDARLSPDLALGAEPLTLTGAIVEGGRVKITGNGADNGLKASLPVRAGQTVIVAFRFALEVVEAGGEKWQAFQATLTFKDAAGRALKTETLLEGALKGTSGAAQSMGQVDNVNRAPARAVSAELSIGLRFASGGVAWVDQVEVWAV